MTTLADSNYGTENRGNSVSSPTRTRSPFLFQWHVTTFDE